MRKHVTAALAGLMALALAACGSGTGGGSASPGATDGGAQSGDKIGEGKELTVWIMEGTAPSAEDFFKEVGADFKEQTGADVKVEFVPWSAAKDKFATAIAGGQTPDVAELGFTMTPEYADAGALMDMTDQLAAAGLDKGFIEAATAASTVDGKVYGAPWYAGLRAFLYNKEIFEKAGIAQPPTNWAELQDAVAKIKQSQPDVIPFPVLGSSEFTVYPWIYGAGGDIATLDGDKWTATINSPEAQEGLTFYTDLALKHGSSTSAAATWNEKDALTNFKNGNVGMILNGSWTPATIKQDSPELYEKLGAFPIPGKESGLAGSVIGGSHLSIFENSEHKELAWEFVKLMTTGEKAKAWGEASNFFPCDTAGIEALSQSTDPLVAPFAQQMAEAGRTVPATPAFGQIQSKKTVVSMMQSILTGKADVKAATDAANAEMQSVFEG